MGNHPALTAVTATFAVSSTVGFFWVLYKMATHSTDYLAALDLTTTGGAATLGGWACLCAVLLYLVFYPEGERAADASALYGAGKVSEAATTMKKLDPKWS